MPNIRTTKAEWFDAPFVPDGPVLNAGIEQLRNDAAKATGQALLGHMEWSGTATLDAGGTDTTFSLGASGIVSVTTISETSNTPRKVWPASGQTPIALTVAGRSNVEPPVAALAPATWYYLYLIDGSGGGGGGLGYVITTDGPDGSLYYSSATQDHRYLVCFRAVPTTGYPVPFWCKKSGGRGVYRYILSGLDPGDPANERCEVLTSGTATTWTAVALSGFVPPHAQLVKLRLRLVNVNGAAQSLQLRATSSIGYEIWTVDANSTLTIDVDFVCDSGESIEYQVTSSGLSARITVLGFEE